MSVVDLSQSATFSDRHREVLAAAMNLVAERGLAAASLRELARRVRVSQPSLYHYFKSKDELVEQVIADYVQQLIQRTMEDAPEAFDTVPELLRAVLCRTLSAWARPEHATFIRFMFAVTMEKPELGATIEQHLMARPRALAGEYMRPFVARGELTAEDAQLLVEVCMDGLIMHFIKRRVLYAGQETPGEADARAEFIVALATGGLDAIRARRGKER